MSIYIIPAIVALLATSYILLHAYQTTGQSKTFFTLVLTFLAHHICEILGFLEFIKNSPHVVYQLKVYYIVSIWCLTYILVYSVEVSKLTIKYLTTLLTVFSAIISIIILYSDSIIAGAHSLGYIMTAQRGEFYFTFQISAILLLLSTIYILIYAYRKTTSHIVKTQSMNVIFAFTPIFISTLVVITLMELGVKINAIAIGPIVTTLFLIIIFRNEGQRKLTDLRRSIPLSNEHQASQEIMALYSSYAQDELSYRDCMTKIERILVMQKYNKSGNNASATAKLMGMPRSSLYSIFNRLKIDIKDQ